MTRRVRIGLAGLGRMGRIHAVNLATRCPSTQLACVFDADPDVARAVGEQHGVRWTASYDGILADDTVDAVAIAAPTSAHAELSVRASQAGKHVFCEKPISLDRQVTIETIDLVQKAGVTFQVGFHRRFDPDWVAATSRIRAGDLGDVYLFRTSLRDMAPPGPEFLAGSGGFFTDFTIHDLDLARWMVGEIVQVSAYGTALSDPGFAEIGDIDTAVVVLQFGNGALGVIDNSRAAGYGYECSTEVMGRKATVRIDHPQYRHYEWRTPGWASHDLARDFEQRYPQAYAEELEAFARCIAGDLEPEVTAYDALAAFDLALAADRSWRSGRPVRVVPVRTAVGVIYQEALSRTVAAPASAGRRPGPGARRVRRAWADAVRSRARLARAGWRPG